MMTLVHAIYSLSDSPQKTGGWARRRPVGKVVPYRHVAEGPAKKSTNVMDSDSAQKYVSTKSKA